MVMASYNLCLGYTCCHSYFPPVQDGFTPLYVACDGGHKQIVDILLKNGANVNLTTTVSVFVVNEICDVLVLFLLSYFCQSIITQLNSKTLTNKRDNSQFQQLL